jgi:hypothetical protein
LALYFWACGDALHDRGRGKGQTGFGEGEIEREGRSIQNIPFKDTTQ